MIKRVPAMQETQVQSLGWEDPLEKEMATPSSTLAQKFHGQRSLVGYSPWGCKELDTTEELHSLTLNEGGDCVAYIHYQISNNGELDISANINI